MLNDLYRFWKQTRAWRRLGATAKATSWPEFVRWRSSLQPGRAPLSDAAPWITFAARDFLEQRLTPASRVFEWGSGGSSLFLANRAAEVTSIEHDPQWFFAVETELKRRGLANWRGELIEPDSQGTARCGPCDPADWRTYQSGGAEFASRTFHRYATRIDDFPDAHFDLIVVDGRARPSCMIHAWPKLKPAGTLVLDNAERDYYEPAKQWLAQTGAVFQSFAGPGPYVRSFWLTCAWTRQHAVAELVRVRFSQDR